MVILHNFLFFRIKPQVHMKFSTPSNNRKISTPRAREITSWKFKYPWIWSPHWVNIHEIIASLKMSPKMEPPIGSKAPRKNQMERNLSKNCGRSFLSTIFLFVLEWGKLSYGEGKTRHHWKLN